MSDSEKSSVLSVSLCGAEPRAGVPSTPEGAFPQELGLFADTPHSACIPALLLPSLPAEGT